MRSSTSKLLSQNKPENWCIVSTYRNIFRAVLNSCFLGFMTPWLGEQFLVIGKFLIRNTKSSITVRKINSWKNTYCSYTTAAGIPHLKLSLYIGSVIPIHWTFVFTSPKEYYLLLPYNWSWKLQRKTSNQKDGTKKNSNKQERKKKITEKRKYFSRITSETFFFPQSFM